jgi:hypothetical protein
MTAFLCVGMKINLEGEKERTLKQSTRLNFACFNTQAEKHKGDVQI